MKQPSEPGSAWQRARAYSWYAWGLSWCYWGIRFANQAFFRSGIRSFDQAIAVWPGFARGYYRRGLIRGRELNQHVLGIADMGRALELAPEWADPYLQRGLFERFHGDQRAALADLKRYVELAGDVYWRDEAQRQIAMIETDLAEGTATDSES